MVTCFSRRRPSNGIRSPARSTAWSLQDLGRPSLETNSTRSRSAQALSACAWAHEAEPTLSLHDVRYGAGGIAYPAHRHRAGEEAQAVPGALSAGELSNVVEQ